MFRRKIETVISEYFNRENSPILVIDGARQIGKTYIISKKCRETFQNFIKIDLKADYDGEQNFLRAKTVESFYLQVSAMPGVTLGNNKDTIIFLDEIQTYPHLLSLLKPLKEDNRYRYIVSGSLLGVTLKHCFIPMGSIQEYPMYPMDFEEFLMALKINETIIKKLKSAFIEKTPIDDGLHKTMLGFFKKYLLTGGLPDAVKAFINEKNINLMRSIQSSIYKYYKDDASQYDSINSLKISKIYDLLPSYMENKVSRIKFNKIDSVKGYTFTRYQDEFDYLLSSGITLGVNAISDIKFPLTQSLSKNLIKLYYNDVGLLSNLLYKNNINAILDDSSNVNLGNIYESFVAQELCAHGHRLFYYDQRKFGEIDFLIDNYDSLSVLPIEVKSGKNFAMHKSLNNVLNTKNQYVKKAIVLSNANVMESDGITYYPIYLTMFL